MWKKMLKKIKKRLKNILTYKRTHGIMYRLTRERQTKTKKNLDN